MARHADTPANRFLDHLIASVPLKNDAMLARFLGLTPPVLSKIRHDRIGVSAGTMILVHERTGMSIAEIKERLTLVPVNAVN